MASKVPSLYSQVEAAEIVSKWITHYDPQLLLDFQQRYVLQIYIAEALDKAHGLNDL